MTEDEIIKNSRCLHTMLPEFSARYQEAVRTGRVKLWANAVRSVIDMVEFDSCSAAEQRQSEEEK